MYRFLANWPNIRGINLVGNKWKKSRRGVEKKAGKKNVSFYENRRFVSNGRNISFCGLYIYTLLNLNS